MDFGMFHLGDCSFRYFFSDPRRIAPAHRPVHGVFMQLAVARLTRRRWDLRELRAWCSSWSPLHMQLSTSTHISHVHCARCHPQPYQPPEGRGVGCLGVHVCTPPTLQPGERGVGCLHIWPRPTHHPLSTPRHRVARSTSTSTNTWSTQRLRGLDVPRRASGRAVAWNFTALADEEGRTFWQSAWSVRRRYCWYDGEQYSVAPCIGRPVLFPCSFLRFFIHRLRPHISCRLFRLGVEGRIHFVPCRPRGLCWAMCHPDFLACARTCGLHACSWMRRPFPSNMGT